MGFFFFGFETFTVFVGQQVGGLGINAPDFYGVVGRAGRQGFCVWRHEETCKVGIVREEVTDRIEASSVGFLEDAPDVDVALIIC